MIRARLLTATAAVALFAGSAAFAQDAMPPAPEAAGEVTTQSEPLPAPAAPVAATPAPAAATPAPAAAAPAQTAAATPASTNTVIDVLKANGQFTTLLTALDAAQLTETLNSAGAISIFAPTDAAFAALPEADRTRLMDPANVNELRQTLLYHVIVADVNSSQIEGSKGAVKTAAETEVQLDGTGDAIKVDDATVTTADIDASNGAVFAIDKVLNPAASQVAAGDAEAATTTEAAPAPAEAAPAPAEAAPPADEMQQPTTPPMTEDMPMDDAAPASTPPVAPTESTTPPMAEDGAMAPAAPATPPTETAPTTAAPTAPSGEPAAATTTTASPPVANPTDGQVDDTDMDEMESDEPAPDAPQS